MKRVLDPVLELSIEERSSSIEMELKYEKLAFKTNLLEQAVFMKDSEKGKTIFDVYNEKMAAMKTYLISESKRQEDLQTESKEVFEERLFLQDSNIQAVMQMSEQIGMIKVSMDKMSDHVAKMNAETLKVLNQHKGESLTENTNL